MSKPVGPGQISDEHCLHPRMVTHPTNHERPFLMSRPDRSTLSRRNALMMAASSSVMGALSACTHPTSASGAPSPTSSSSTPALPPSSPSAPSPSTTVNAPQQTFTRAPIPAHPVSTVPAGPDRQIALTIDDGIRADVIEGYAHLCEKTGMRLTFFANGCYESWRETRNLLAPLIESGQIAIGNHTFDHPDIRRSNITAHQLERQILDNEKVFRNLFGSQFSMRPYFRPPYGYYDAASLRQLRDMWVTPASPCGMERPVTTRTSRHRRSCAI